MFNKIKKAILQVKQHLSAGHIENNENRAMILAEYYKISIEVINKIQSSTKDANLLKYTAIEYGIDPNIRRTMLDYTRYPESRLIANTLKELGIRISGFSVLDFGCLVSDYGIFFARRGAKITVYDYETYIDFVKFRFGREGLEVETVKIPAEYPKLFENNDLIIFGEVLEHLHNPLLLLRTCADRKVKYIFTSCYPYGDENYFSRPGHKETAQLQQPACQKLLKENYLEIILGKKRRLWVLQPELLRTT